MSDKKKEVIFFRESFKQSVASDLSTYGFLLGSFYLNERFIDGNNLVAAILLVMFVLFLVSKQGTKKHTFTSRQELLDHLKGGDGS